ncbi:MAG TPA: type II secretion system protein [Deltaproteobacteria bacterium]|nr:type II secretion system protein [Deltaproteobacteria bacterium]
MRTTEIMRDRRRIGDGFSLIETVTVLAVLAIVSAFLVSQGLSTDAVNAQADANTLKSHLRYAQSLAMNDLPTARWGVEIDGSSYSLVCDGDTCPDDIPVFPNESSSTISFSPNVAASPTGTILFDNWGSPGADDLPVTIDTNGETVETMTITAETGFIP